MASASYIPLLAKVEPGTGNDELQGLLRKNMEERGRQNIFRLRLWGMRDPEVRFDLRCLEREFRIAEILDETEPEYVVRRLTPTECARLQGFPDWWCAGLGTDEPTEEEIEFWTEVFEIHRSVMGTSSKPKSRNQIVKWLKNPHSDSAEYKMWGNGVALPNVYFVLSGIVYYSQFPDFLL